MNEKERTKISRFLSLVLRHKPQEIGLHLDGRGWADIAELIEKAAAAGKIFTVQELGEIVATNEKQRFAYNEDRTRIRASQGHSIEVELQLEAANPPEQLYHGTVDKFLRAIQSQGLRKMNRHHVHMSKDVNGGESRGAKRRSHYPDH